VHPAVGSVDEHPARIAAASTATIARPEICFMAASVSRTPWQILWCRHCTKRTERRCERIPVFAPA
jgi:hypothetical protein